MIFKIQNFCEKKIPPLPAAGIRAQVFRLPRNFEFLISLKIVSQYDVNSEFD